MFMASQSAFSRIWQVITSEAESAIAWAARAMCVGVQMLGGASTRYLHCTTLLQFHWRQCTVVIAAAWNMSGVCRYRVQV